MEASGSTQQTTALSDFGERWLAGWNVHDPDALAQLCHPEIVWDEPAPRRTLHGREEVREWIAKNFIAFPDLEIDVVQEFTSQADDHAAVWWKLRGTHDGTLSPPGFAPTGKRIEIEGADFVELRDGLLFRMRMIYDVYDLSVQLGLLPGPGTPLESGLVAMQRGGVALRQQLETWFGGG